MQCGWNGTPNHQMLRDEHGDVALIVSDKACPACGSRTVQLDEPKPSIPIQIVTALREADLAPDELTQLANALRSAAPDASPRAVGNVHRSRRPRN